MDYLDFFPLASKLAVSSKGIRSFTNITKFFSSKKMYIRLTINTTHFNKKYEGRSFSVAIKTSLSCPNTYYHENSKLSSF